jgi:hypothetical protein
MNSKVAKAIGASMVMLVALIALISLGFNSTVEYPDEKYIQDTMNARLAPTGGATDGMAKQAMITRVYNLNCAATDGGVACQWDQDSAGGYTIKGKTAKFAKGQKGWLETR